MNVTTRPLTRTTDEAARFVAMMRAPVTLTDHLLHAWDALDAFDRGERLTTNLAYANRMHSAALRIAPSVETAVSAAAEVGALGLALQGRKAV